jgi:hypothetical protein
VVVIGLVACRIPKGILHWKFRLAAKHSIRNALLGRTQHRVSPAFFTGCISDGMQASVIFTILRQQFEIFDFLSKFFAEIVCDTIIFRNFVWGNLAHIVY